MATADCVIQQKERLYFGPVHYTSAQQNRGGRKYDKRVPQPCSDLAWLPVISTNNRDLQEYKKEIHSRTGSQLVECTKPEVSTHLLDERGHLLLAVLELGLDAFALGVVRLHVLLGLV